MMHMAPVLYELLGIPRNATPAEINRAYRKKAKTAHPDAGGSADKFMQLKIAHTVLTDPELRAHYDATGEIKSKAVDHFRQKVMEIIASIMDGLLNECSKQGFAVGNLDLIPAMKAAIQAGVDNIEKQIKELSKKKAQYEEILKRVSTTKTGGENVLGLLAQSQINFIEEKIRQQTEERKPLDAAMAIVSDHRFAHDAMNQMANMFGRGTSAATQQGWSAW